MSVCDCEHPEAIRVGIADDHPVVLVGISQIIELENDMTVTLNASDPEALCLLLGRRPCDVLVCDYAFDQSGARDGIQLIESIRRMHPDIKILMLTMHNEHALIRKLFGAGVRGFLCKTSATSSRIAAAVRTVASDELYIDPAVAVTLSGEYLRRLTKEGDERESKLSRREYEVVRLISRGMKINEIARQICRSPKTISTQKASAMRKLAAQNNIELVMQFRRLGY
ncbi:hypothetical protein BWP39_09845 [Paraburkholderia acidicola]|uniref:Transcriptional regulatory protein RcsB n=1 Tax=Paraburkholderia acidicola TaxID=1912599 RepID=A0A2A4F3Z6_9BURK|nr:response regulator transcription factor [Paraburkholderia acidicola]PCE27079.1 hypothetical protein BWP39_09845 [Paraburkholderia acidicola]